MTPDAASGPAQGANTQVQGKSSTKLTREEESNLADYLSIGVYIEDARAAFDTVVKAAKLRLRERESQRARQFSQLVEMSSFQNCFE